MTLHIEKSGNGVPLVFLHAFPLNRKMWDADRDSFSRHFQVLTVDLPGFGKSLPFDKSILTMEYAAETVANELTRTHGIESAIFVGCSMGGYVLLEILNRAPKLVRSAVFVSTRAKSDTEAARQKRITAIESLDEKDGQSQFIRNMRSALIGQSTHSLNPSIANKAEEIMNEASSSAIAAALRGMANRRDNTSQLSNITCPTLVLSGEEDAVVNPKEMKEMADMIPHSQFEVMPQAGHLLNMEYPSKFHDLVITFFKRKVL